MLKLVIPEHYIHMALNSLLMYLAYPSTNVEDYTTNSDLHPDTNETSLDISPTSKSLSLHCKQISRAKNEIDGQKAYLVDYMQVFGYKTAFTPMHLVFIN